MGDCRIGLTLFGESSLNQLQYRLVHLFDMPPFGIYAMCRNIKTLFNFEPPATDEEIRAAALQYVRKVSGFQKPSQANEAAFHAAIDEIAAVTATLLNTLETTAQPKNRAEEAAKAKVRSAQRFSS